MVEKQLKVADFFCGAGGFSEGFRQNGYDISFALDYWQPAIDTFNMNHPGCNAVKMNILDLRTPEDIDAIVPDVDVIIGSPPCVSFSSSNRSGKANKDHGIELILAYLRIITWKKRKGRLKYWLLENVPNAGTYVKDEYTWNELGLPGKGPNLSIKKRVILNAAEYGVPQTRKRLFCGDFPIPDPILKDPSEWVTIKTVLDSLKDPSCKHYKGIVHDPIYLISITADKLSDHFYDTRIPDIEWKNAKRLKEDHGFMGRMSFPENIDRPSRTIVATRSASTREAIIFKAFDEANEPQCYRLPTIREISSFMSFPITYQFEASNENSKYRLVGNAVCPGLSSAIARSILIEEKMKIPSNIDLIHDLMSSVDLRDTKRSKKRHYLKKPDSKFAIHIPYMKIRGFRVELSNVDSDFRRGDVVWSCILHQGSGKNALKCRSDACDINGFLKKIPHAREFKKDVQHEFKKMSMTHSDLQKAYISMCESSSLTPYNVLEVIKGIVDRHFPSNDAVVDNSNRMIKIDRDQIPERIVAGLYACDYFVGCLERS